MDQRVKAKWIKALESGKYEQGQNCLRDGDKFCCLGVLVDLYTKEKGFKKWGVPHSNFWLSNAAKKWAGLEQTDPELSKDVPRKDGVGGDCYTLSQMNDRGHSFKSIANTIRRQF